MNIETLNLKVLRVRESDYLFIINKNCNLSAFIDKNIRPNAMKISQEEANEILNLLSIDNTLAFIHFNQLWEKYHEIKNL